MRINIHDKFKSWRHFIDVVKQLYKFLDSHNLEVRTITSYITVANKDTNKCTTLYIVDKDDESDCEEVGFDIGYFEWEDTKKDGMTIKCERESELLNQMQYKSKRYHYQAEERQKEKLKRDANAAKEFEEKYLPVRSLTKKTGVKKCDFKTVKQISNYGYDWKKVKRAIDNDACYKDCRWKSLRMNDDKN